MKYSIFFGFLLVLLMQKNTAFSQTPTDQSPTVRQQYWVTVSLVKPIKKYILGAEQGIGLSQNSWAMKNLPATYTQLSMDYKPLIYFWEIGLAYRYGISADENFVSHRFDFNWSNDAEIKLSKKKKLVLNNRVRYSQYLPRFGKPQEALIRDALTIHYRKKDRPWEYFLGAELFYSLQYDFKDFSRYRVGFGAIYNQKFNKRLKLAYLFQQDINTSKPRLTHIINIDYRLKW